MIERITVPRVSQAPFGWAILAAGGAAFFAGAAVIVVVTLLYRALGIGADSVLPRANELATIAAVGAALAVAYAAGGRFAVAGYAAIAVVARFLELATQLRFCAAIFPAPPSCSLFGSLIGLWPYVLGALVGYGLARWLRATAGGGNPLLEVAGALGLTRSVAFDLLSFMFISTSDLAAGLLQLVVFLGAGLACGIVLLRRVGTSRQWAALAIIAIVALAEWAVVTLPVFLEQSGVGGKISLNGLALVALFSPFFELGAAALVLYMAAARRVTATAS